MISIRSSADMARALDGALDPPLRHLLIIRRDQLSEHDGYDLGELVHIIVAQPGDTLAAIEAEASLPVDFSSFEYVERRCGWLEAVRRHIVTRWGKVRLTDIDGRAVAQWLADKRAEGLAPATVVKIKAIFGRSFELGARWGVPGCERNPVRGIESKPLNNARERYLTSAEAARLLAAAEQSRNPQLASVVGLLLLTRMRVSELLSTRWEHVDLDHRGIFVPTSKTGRTRHVPLAQAAIDIIQRLPKREAAIYLFPSPKDAKKHLTTIKHGWQTVRDAASLPGLRIHDLRHSAASFMVNSGIDLFAVGKVLGHANVASSARYSHLANDTLLAAVEAGAAKQASI